MKQDPIIIFQEVTIGYPGRPILENVNWEIRNGENWIVGGLNGLGKTTLVRTLAGRLRPLRGSIKRNIEDPFTAISLVSFTDTSKLFKSVNHVHYHQQRFNSWDSDGHLTVAQYLAAGGYSQQNVLHNELINQFELKDLLQRERIKLSSGQTRKMLIAKAILGRPKVLILDNPYIGLDTPSRKYMNDLLDRLVVELDMTLILSGQFTALPTCINSRLDLENGLVISGPSIAKQNKDGQENKAAGLLKEIKSTWSKNRIPLHSDSVFKFENVDISYGQHSLVKNINWDVKVGEKWNLKGNNGSGKSTLISLMYGDNPQVYARKIFVFGNRRGKGESIWDIKRKIGFTSAEIHAYIDSSLSALDVVLTGLFDKFELMDDPKANEIKFAKKLLDYFNLLWIRDKEFSLLSTGHQRIVLLLRALIKAPPVLILDEPFQGFDESNINLAKHLLDELLTDNDTLIFISHFQNEVPDCVGQVMAL